MNILDDVHHICPTLQRNHLKVKNPTLRLCKLETYQEYCNPGQPNVVKGNSSMEWVGRASGAVGVEL